MPVANIKTLLFQMMLAFIVAPPCNYEMDKGVWQEPLVLALVPSYAWLLRRNLFASQAKINTSTRSPRKRGQRLVVGCDCSASLVVAPAPAAVPVAAAPV